MAAAIQSYRDLHVWQKAIELVVASYRATHRFPDAERYGLTSQIQRAAVSIPANLAEGRARESTKDFLRHIGIATGSLAELETHLEIAKRLSYLNASQAEALTSAALEIGRMLTGLRASLRRKLT